jgi:hypothetical protein
LYGFYNKCSDDRAIHLKRSSEIFEAAEPDGKARRAHGSGIGEERLED